MSSLAHLEAEFTRIAADVGGVVGVAAVHVESGAQAAHEGDKPLPMASLVKVPLALEVLARVDAGDLRLADMVTLSPGDERPGAGTTSARIRPHGVSLAVGELFDLMMVLSDNAASDAMLRAVGGPGSVTARMRAIGEESIAMHRSLLDVMAESSGLSRDDVERWRASDAPTTKRWREIRAQIPPDVITGRGRAFLDDARDTASARAIARLLARAARGELLSEESTARLLDTMRRCGTGQSRIPALLPPRTPVAHKTGSLTVGMVGDVGIVDLPAGRGRLALAVVVTRSPRPEHERERAIAEIARAAYEWFARG